MAMSLKDTPIVGLGDEDDHVNVLVYGDSGVGKTVFAGSDDKVLFVAPEDKGTLSAKRRGSTAMKWPVTHWSDVVKAYDWLYDQGQTEEGIQFNWVVLDSLTELQELAMRGILDDVIKANPSRDPDIPALADWQKYYEMVKRMVKGFNNLPVNVLYTALTRMTTENGLEYGIPDLQGKKDQYAKKASSWMTSFGQIRLVKAEREVDGKTVTVENRKIYWKNTDTSTGKDRTGALNVTTNKSLKDIRLMIEKRGLQVEQENSKANPAPQQEATASESEESVKSEESETIDA